MSTEQNNISLSDEDTQAIVQGLMPAMSAVYAREKEREFFHAMLDLELDICAIEDDSLRDTLQAGFYHMRNVAKDTLAAVNVKANMASQTQGGE